MVGTVRKTESWNILRSELRRFGHSRFISPQEPIKTELESLEYLEEWKLDSGYYPRNKKNSQQAGMELVIVNLNLGLKRICYDCRRHKKTFHK